jgi:hypothetical protein
MERIVPACDDAALRGARVPFPLSLREPADFHEPVPISERLVQAIWADQLFNADDLRTRDGRPVRILSPGRWNVEGGPDFTGARIEIGGTLLRGDVEIHLHATGWRNHAHDANPAYAGVVLDVCLWALESPEPLARHGGGTVPQLALSPYVEGSLGELTESLDPDSYPLTPARIRASLSPLDGLDHAQKLGRVEAAGFFRFERKSKRLARFIEEVGPEQAAYEALAETLGYKHNRRPFLRIAASTRLATIALLPDADARIEALLSAARSFSLRIHQVRPANHPARRLAALALIVSSHPRLDEWFAALVAQPERLRRPPVLDHPFWSHHYHAGGTHFPSPISLIGPDRWREIVVNVVIPFAHARAAERDAKGECTHLQELWADRPAPASNLVSRQMAYELGIPAPRRTVLQQGLIQIRIDGDLLAPGDD